MSKMLVQMSKKHLKISFYLSERSQLLIKQGEAENLITKARFLVLEDEKNGILF